MIAQFKDRVQSALHWRWRRVRRRMHRLVLRLGSRCYVRLRWPWPLRKPYQRRQLRLATHASGIGDELMATPIFREIKRRNPACHLTFVSRYPELFRGNQVLDALEPWPGTGEPEAVMLSLRGAAPPPRPLITLMAEELGLVLRAGQLDRPQLAPSPEIRRALESVPLPRVALQTVASRWTPNKQWPAASWLDLVKRLTVRCAVMELGTESCLPLAELGPRFHSFVGRTSLTDFAWLISQAVVFVGPPSGGMHLANAFEVPSVILFGGYESPADYEYPRTISFYSPVECAPCWLTTPCPHELKCMRQIQPDAVHRAICGFLDEVSKSAATALS